MFASIRRHRLAEGSLDELIRRVDESFAEQLSARAGFLSYELVDCGHGEVTAVTLFSEEQDAQASRELAARWTEANLADMKFLRLEALHGFVLVNRAHDEVLRPGPRFATLRRYQLRGGTAEEVMQVVDEVFADLIEGMDGFEAYHALDCASDEIMSISMFRDRASAEESDVRSLQFVSEYLQRFDIERTELISGEVRVSRAAAPLLEPTHA